MLALAEGAAQPRAALDGAKQRDCRVTTSMTT